MIVDSRDSVNVLKKTVSRARLLRFSSSIPGQGASFVTPTIVVKRAALLPRITFDTC